MIPRNLNYLDLLEFTVSRCRWKTTTDSNIIERTTLKLKTLYTACSLQSGTIAGLIWSQVEAVFNQGELTLNLAQNLP